MSENHKEKGDLGEDFVNELAFNSFVKYWCFPNPKDENGDKKEISDLLILFENICIIISVKNYTFKGDHKRYFKNTIDKAIRQIYGAERKLFNSSHKITFIHPERGVYNFDPDDYTKIFRVIINLGEGELFYLIGSDEQKKEFINIFNKEAFLVLTNELDTISDFIEYLEKREELFKTKDVIMLSGPDEDYTDEANIEFLEYSTKRDFRNRKSITITGTEKDLLAHYFLFKRDFSSIVKSDEYTGLWLDIEGEWDNYFSNKKVAAKKEEDRISYFIDNLVKREILSLENGHIFAKILFSFNRFERRMIAKTFYNFYEKFNPKASRDYFMAKRYTEVKDWGLVCFIYAEDISDEINEFAMELAIDGFAHWTKYKMKNIFCLAVRHNMSQFKFMYKEIIPFSDEKLRQVQEDCKKINWFQNITTTPYSEKEYPE